MVPQTPVWVKKKEHFLSDPGQVVQVLSGPKVFVGAAQASARPGRRGIPGARGQGSPAPHLGQTGPRAPQAAGIVRGPRSSAGTQGPHPGRRIIHSLVVALVRAANSR